MKEHQNNLLEASELKEHPNTVSLTLRFLLEIQVNMIKTISIVSDEDFYIHPLSETKKDSISKKLNEIKIYLEKEMESVSDLIFALREAVVSECSLEE